jgi:hypothetical protein
MTRPCLEVADVFREYGSAYLEAYGDVTTTEQRRVLRDLQRCRTAALGGHVEECDRCGYVRIAYNSCRNRHCPKCQATLRARWLDERAAELLPDGEYFHVIFTLPNALGPVALQNQRVIYGALFRATAETLLEIARDPQHLGAQIGLLGVLHTWGQNLRLHPHVHCVVPGGGISLDGTRWVACRPGFFLPVRVLSRLFRGKFLALLADAYRQRRLTFHGRLEHLNEATAFAELLGELRKLEWVVYAKPPFGGPERVLKYLARYTHRVAISNRRLIKLEDGKVHFAWKDYADGGAVKTMALDAVEFIRRFLQHVVPSGFVRVRHFGFLANRKREAKLQLCRELLSGEQAQGSACAGEAQGNRQQVESVAKVDNRCPACGEGRMRVAEVLLPESSGKSLAREAETLVVGEP